MALRQDVRRRWSKIAEYLGVSTEQVLEALEADGARHAGSLDEPLVSDVNDDSATIHESIGTEDEGHELVDTAASLAAAVKQLRRTDREVLALRFRDALKQSETADRIGVSPMQVSRILRRVSDDLRERIGFESG